MEFFFKPCILASVYFYCHVVVGINIVASIVSIFTDVLVRLYFMLAEVQFAFLLKHTLICPFIRYIYHTGALHRYTTTNNGADI